MTELRQLSTHLQKGRDRASKDQHLEGWLQNWGEWRAKQLNGLSVPSSTPIAVAMQMRLEQGAIPNDIAAPKETRVILPVTPHYYTHARMNELDRFISQMNEMHRKALIKRYEFGYSGIKIAATLGWEVNSYYAIISEARKIIRKDCKTIR